MAITRKRSGECEEQQAGGLQHACNGDVRADADSRHIRVAEAEDDDHHCREHRKHHGDDGAGQER
ncbi:hypothetical protein MGALJ_49770 [Mycobacterium gallinarum]|uniref:Uncharacterized protein n=1 Tax=Mycobacterium gallinarum TaxID=39689 RepID=A0A9W4B786_9MYCO|nr:hypothetical protein MGALJ_49770 [Mycobacterium gallinarum]